MTESEFRVVVDAGKHDFVKKFGNLKIIAGNNVNVTAIVKIKAVAQPTPIVCIKFKGNIIKPRKHMVNVIPLARIIFPLDRNTFIIAVSNSILSNETYGSCD